MQSRIRGVSLFMGKFDFLFGAMLGECLLIRHSGNLSKALQSPQVSAAGQKMAAHTVLRNPGNIS